MASDLSHTPSTGIMVQACGDAHIANFGMFRSPEGRTVFDINDFDETAPGPWEWDLKRLVTSVEICGRDRGFSAKERKTAMRMCAQSYRTSMLGFAKMGHLDVWHDHIDLDELFDLNGGIPRNPQPRDPSGGATLSRCRHRAQGGRRRQRRDASPRGGA